MRYLITIEYLGLNYSGWQRQANAISIQEVIEDSLCKFFGEKITLFASGRTDKGVHAIAQTAHFDANKYIEENKLPHAINNLLPLDIRIKKAEKVNNDFHARYNARKKTYIYKFYVSRIIRPTMAITHAQITPPVDFEKMKEACADLIGTYDYKCLSATGSSVKSSVRTVYESSLEQNGDEIIFTITANGFLYNMVRMIVGTLVFIGKGMREKDAFKRLLNEQDKSARGKTFPPEGLYLAEVIY